MNHIQVLKSISIVLNVMTEHQLFLSVAVSKLEDWNRAAGVDSMIGDANPGGEDVMRASTASGTPTGT